MPTIACLIWSATALALVAVAAVAEAGSSAGSGSSNGAGNSNIRYPVHVIGSDQTWLNGVYVPLPGRPSAFLQEPRGNIERRNLVQGYLVRGGAGG